LFSEQGETMQCAVWKDDHEQTETTVSVFVFKNRKPKSNHGFGMKKTENRTEFQISKPLHH